MAKKTRVELAITDNLDVVRTLKRLEHRILCRHELNEIEDQVRKTTSAKVLRGLLPKIIDVKKLADEL